METKKFIDILEIYNGKNQKSVENPDGKYPIYGSGGVMGRADEYICPAETVVIGRKGSINNPIFVTEPFWNVDTAFGLVARKEVLLPKYLFYFCRYFDFEKLNTTVTIPSLTKANLLKIEIPIPSIIEQKSIVTKLNLLTDMIQQRQEQLTKLDELIKARFVEMFGDPDQNPKGWPLVSITEIIRDKASNGFFAKRDAYKDDGNVQILGVSNVVNRMYSNTKELPRTDATQAEKEKYSVKYGDMLFCRSSLVADGIGKASIVAKGTFPNVLFECHVIRLSLDLQKCVPEFVQVLSTTPFFRRQIIAQSKTATMTTIGQDGILKSSVVLPPIDLQNQFADFVAEVDKSKLFAELFAQNACILAENRSK